MIEFKTKLKATISTDYSSKGSNNQNVFSTTYSAPLKKRVIDRRMRTQGSKFKSRLIMDERMKKDE